VAGFAGLSQIHAPVGNGDRRIRDKRPMIGNGRSTKAVIGRLFRCPPAECSVGGQIAVAPWH
jgi:hypothetical protein